MNFVTPSLTLESQPTTKSWLLISRSESDTTKIQESVDQLLDGYSFYPEVEWASYGYRPPDGYQVLGAWRHPDSASFVFLLDNPRMLSHRTAKQFIVYSAGFEKELARFERPILSLKKTLRKNASQLQTDANIQKSLASSHRAKSVKRLLGLLCLFTAATNALSLYLRRIPSPVSGTGKVAEMYASLLVGVHMAALLLLLSFIVICLVYTLKYGILIVRQR